MIVHFSCKIRLDGCPVQQRVEVLLIDTHPGLNVETFISIAISDALVLIMRPDQQDYLGTAVSVEVARKLDVPKLLLVVNNVAGSFTLADFKKRVEQTYNCDVTAVILTPTR